jgi:hypothetical protein
MRMTLLTTIRLLALLASGLSVTARASDGEHPVDRHYVTAPSAPASQSDESVQAKSAGCLSCHTQTDAPSMHSNPAVRLGCTDCHGGNSELTLSTGIQRNSEAYTKVFESAHVLPRFPKAWHYPSSANPEQTYTLLNRESPEFIRFINPSDYRVARESCGACHADVIEASVRSLHSTGAMLWGGAAYNNGILDFKQYILGEAYDRNGGAILLEGPKIPEHLADQAAIAGILPQLAPLPAWETIEPGDIFRVFERGGRNIGTQFPETGLPSSAGQLQRTEEPGRPDFKQSNRGPGTGARIAVPVINITKTRLNDPLAWFMGTNDQPGD